MKGIRMANLAFKKQGERPFSADSHDLRLRRLRKRAGSWVKAAWTIKNRMSKPTRFVGITLTYRDGVDWEPLHVSDCIKLMRSHLNNKKVGKQLYGYLWVAELQERGAVHYHLCLAVDPRAKIPYFDEAGWWPHGMTRVETLRGPNETYLGKYLEKSEQKRDEFPRGLRMFAAVLCIDVTDEALFWFRMSGAPPCVYKAIMAFWHDMKWKKTPFPYARARGWKWKPMPGGGWLVSIAPFSVERARAEVWFSDYECLGVVVDDVEGDESEAFEVEEGYWDRLVSALPGVRLGGDPSC